MTTARLLTFLSFAWPIVSALLVLAFRTRTPAEWIALGEKSPRIQGAIKMLRGAGLDPPKVLEGAVQVFTGRLPAESLRIVDAVTPILARDIEHTLPRPDVPAPIEPAAPLTTGIGARAADDER